MRFEHVKDDVLPAATEQRRKMAGRSLSPPPVREATRQSIPFSAASGRASGTSSTGKTSTAASGRGSQQQRQSRGDPRRSSESATIGSSVAPFRRTVVASGQHVFLDPAAFTGLPGGSEDATDGQAAMSGCASRAQSVSAVAAPVLTAVERVRREIQHERFVRHMSVRQRPASGAMASHTRRDPFRMFPGPTEPVPHVQRRERLERQRTAVAEAALRRTVGDDDVAAAAGTIGRSVMTRARSRRKGWFAGATPAWH